LFLSHRSHRRGLPPLQGECSASALRASRPRGRCKCPGWRGRLPMRAPVCAVVLVLLLAPLGASRAALSQAAACAKADFEAVVNAAGAALRDLAQQNTPVFQSKLLQLKDKRSWSNDELKTQAGPLLRDETTTGLDKKSEELVARITGGGGQADA